MDVLYSELYDGEILVSKNTLTNQFVLTTRIDIQTLFKEKRSKAIEMAEILSKLEHTSLLNITKPFQLLNHG